MADILAQKVLDILIWWSCFCLMRVQKQLNSIRSYRDRYKLPNVKRKFDDT